MPLVCCVPFCSSAFGKKSKEAHISFHQFPSDENLCKLWIKNISRKDFGVDEAYKSPSKVVCSLHFKDSDYSSGLKVRRLKKEALPTIFQKYPKYMQPKEICPRKTTSRDSESLPSKILKGASTLTLQEARKKQITNFEEPSSPDNSLKETELETIPAATQSTPAATQTTQGDTLKMERTINILRCKIRRLNEKLQEQQVRLQDQQDQIQSHQIQLRELPVKKVQQLLVDADDKDDKAIFLLDLVRNYKKKRPSWNAVSVGLCALWILTSPKGYNYVRKNGILCLPSKRTIKRHVGGIYGETGVTPQIKERLRLQASQLPAKDRFTTLKIDEMSIKAQVIYDKNLDQWIGLKDTTKHINTILSDASTLHQGQPSTSDQYEPTNPKDPVPANHLLCFMICGISVSFNIPGAYFFSRQLTGGDLYQLTLSVIRELEDCGFFITHVSVDNHKTNCAMFRLLGDGPRTELTPTVPHPLDESRVLHLSFDPSHIIKNIKHKFLETESAEGSEDVSGKYVIQLYELQKNENVKPVRCLTRKAVYPSNFEKMNVKRAIDVFSPQVIAALEFLMTFTGSHPVAYKFKTAGPTIAYMKNIQKWYNLHNVGTMSLGYESRNPNKFPFFSINDERLAWLENDFLLYIEDVQKECEKKVLTTETYQALIITTLSTVSCVKYLLKSGFHFVLTRKLTSDSIEMFFSILRQMTGGNDMLDARATMFSLEHILKRGTIAKTMPNTSNVPKDSFIDIDCRLQAELEEWDKMMNTFNNVKKLPSAVTDILNELSKYPDTQRTTLRLASISYLAGYIVRIMEEKNFCQLCTENVSQADSDSPLVGLIKFADRGNLRYPRQCFVMLMATVTKFVEQAVPYLREAPGIRQNIENHLMPEISACPYIQCDLGDDHPTQIAEIICKKVVPPLIDNIARTISARYEKVKELVTKPLSRKVHKV